MLGENNRDDMLSVPSKIASGAKVICFRATEPMCAVIDRIMDERMIDRTTVMKLALYHFDSYMRRDDVQGKDLFDIVKDLEKAAPRNQGRFADFSLPVKDD